MDEQVESLPVHACAINGFLNGLQLTEVVAAADGAQCTRIAVARHTERFEPVRGVVEFDIFEPAQLGCGLVELELPEGKIEFEQGHAAADIVADKLGIEPVTACRHAHRAILARVEVGERSDRHHARQGRDIVELFFCRAFDPGRGGVET
jgi:hypothetical protein